MAPGAQGSPGVLQSVSIIRRISRTRTNSVAHVGQRYAHRIPVAVAVTGPSPTTARLRQAGHIRSRVSGTRGGDEGSTEGQPRARPRAYRPRALAALVGSGVTVTRCTAGLAAHLVPMAGPDGRRALRTRIGPEDGRSARVPEPDARRPRRGSMRRASGPHPPPHRHDSPSPSGCWSRSPRSRRRSPHDPGRPTRAGWRRVASGRRRVFPESGYEGKAGPRGPPGVCRFDTPDSPGSRRQQRQPDKAEVQARGIVRPPPLRGLVDVSPSCAVARRRPRVPAPARSRA